MSGVSITDTVYRLSKPSERAEFDRKVENWGAKCYQATASPSPREVTPDYFEALNQNGEIGKEPHMEKEQKPCAHSSPTQDQTQSDFCLLSG